MVAAEAQESKVFATAKNSAAGLTLEISAQKAVKFGGAMLDIIDNGEPTSSQILLSNVSLLPAINAATSTTAGTQTSSGYALSDLKSYVKYGENDYREDTKGMTDKHAAIQVTLTYNASSLNANVSHKIAITMDKDAGESSVPWLVGRLSDTTYTNIIDPANALTIVGGTQGVETFIFYVDGTNVGDDGSKVDVDAHTYHFTFTPSVL